MPSNQYMKGFADRLRIAREQAGYDSARIFADALGIKEQTYRRYERGETTPPYELLRDICKLTKQHADFFI